MKVVNEPLSTKTYDALKHIVQVILPAFASLYFGLAAVWHFPDPEQVVGSIALLTTFLGVCLHISNAQYTSPGSDGELHVTTDEDGTQVFAALNQEPAELAKQKTVTLTVAKHKPRAVKPSPRG